MRPLMSKRNLLKSLVAFVAWFAILAPVAWAQYDFTKQSSVHIVETDMMLDDIGALEAMAETIMKGNQGENLIIITADGDTRLKAEAVYKYLAMLGKEKVTVIAGQRAYSQYPFDYQEAYLDDRGKKYLETMAGLQGPEWRENHPRAVMKAVANSNARVHLYSFANPLNMNSMILETGLHDAQIEQIVTMGIYRRAGDGQGLTSYNANVELDALMRFVSLVKGKFDVLHFPSDLFYRDNIMNDIDPNRRKLLDRNNPAVVAIDGSMRQYQQILGDEVLRRHGPLPPWAQLFDPQKTWPQDLLTFAASTLDRGELQLREVNVEVDLTNYSRGALGVGVRRTAQAGTRFYEVQELPVAGITTRLKKAYDAAKFIPSMDPSKMLQFEGRPAALITKGAIDDIAIARSMFVVLKDRLRMIYTESVDAGTTAEVFRHMATAYNSDAKVANGTGELKSGVPNLKAEEYMASMGIGKQVVGKEIAFGRSNVNNPEGYREIIRLLEDHPGGIDLFVTTSVRDLTRALTERPDLVGRIANLHIMGGARADGLLTRNWALDPAATRNLFAIVAQAKIKTFVYSSGLLGGSITEARFPETTRSLKVLSRSYGIETGLNNMRLQWNQAIGKTLGIKQFDVQGNYGSPLAYVMALAAVTGENFNSIASGRNVSVQFNENKVLFDTVSEDASSIVLLDKFESYERSTMDRIMSQIHEYAMGMLGEAKGCAQVAASGIL
jgi:inosine-uridine nucleoside N-ribohydrolase